MLIQPGHAVWSGLKISVKSYHVVDLTGALTKMSTDGLAVTPELVASISPYTREHIRRFGRYILDMNDLPSPFEPALLSFEPAPDSPDSTRPEAA